MKTVQVEIPEKWAAKIESLVKDGWFHDEGELIRGAISEYLRRHNPELIEYYHRKDLEWAMNLEKEKRKASS